ncbi:type IV secretion system protein VirB8 [Sphingobium sp. AP50]|uniref:virB8 family protein n=1 Tax=Sphingobium sp. AP50 TaxID=1884369 RepID=UPI0008D0C774|nr:type IV secretion system protein [Sphingobium sp. AP50]SEJ81056.1 type IV secretion system protein VirB8 [Sphingobium sp. AP50]
MRSSTEGVPSADAERYFNQARSWDQDRQRKSLRSERIAWIIAGLAVLVSLVEGFALAGLAPLKSVVPYVIRVNATTGAVDVQTALTDKPMRYDEAVTKFFLAQYVRARESWLPAAAEENFRSVTILSDPGEQQRWGKFFSSNNSASPQVVWGKTATVQARVRNIAFINDRVANIRFTRTVQTDTDTQSSDWIATVTFKYTNAPMAEGDRYRNPLGFQVENYRADPEVVR